MSKGVYLKTADIYLRFPEIMEEECNDLAEFLEDEHIVYEGATDVFIEKDKKIEEQTEYISTLQSIIEDDKENFILLDKEIERLNKECDTYMKIATKKDNIINELEKYLIEKIEYMKSHSIERMITYDDCLYKLKELKEGDNNE